MRNQIKFIQKRNDNLAVYVLNKLIVGLHNYYRIATEVNKDFSKIHYNLSYCLKSRLRSIRTKSGYKSKEYENKYCSYGGKCIYILGVVIYPINCITTKIPRVCNQSITNYTEKGRQLIHKKLGYLDQELITYLIHNPVLDKSIEYNDNRLSLYSAQKGRCSITNQLLNETMEVHHKIPYHKNGSDEYKNLTLVTYEIHKLIHATNPDIIRKYITVLNLTKKAMNKVNKYRMKLGNEIILSE